MSNYNQWKKQKNNNNKKELDLKIRSLENQFEWTAPQECVELMPFFDDTVKVYSWFRDAYFNHASKQILFCKPHKLNWVNQNYREKLKKAGFGEYELKMSIQ